MSRVFAYARVSTVDQLTENQAEQIAQAGYSIQPKRYIEEKVSGSVPTAQRAGFQKLMDRMEEGDTLVVTKLDGIGRDSIDVQQTVKRCAERGIRLVVLQLGNLDLTSSAGELMVKVLAAVADFERDLIIDTLRHCFGNRTHAATILGISIRTLRNKLRQYSGEGVAIPAPASVPPLAGATLLSA